MPEAGNVIGGKYRLRHPIGEGAMASVWSAVHETLGRPVAVKFIHAKARTNEVVTARFMREARIAAAVQHRFVVDIFDFGETKDGEPYMVMERLDGETLANRITRGPPIPVKTFVRMVEECLTGLDAVHTAGIVHRDLKPENIFVINDGDGSFPKLLDFGISRIEDQALTGDRKTKLTRDGAVIGTPWYMSPEQVRGRSDLDHRTDLYAMAVILFEVLSGCLPFDSDTLGDLMVRIATEEAVPLVTLRPDLPVELSDIIAQGMAKDPAKRFPDATTFRIALRKVRRELPDDAFTVVMKPTPSEPPEKLGSADMLVRPRVPSVPPKPGPGSVSETLPGDGGRQLAETIEAAPKNEPRRNGTRIAIAAIVLVAVAGIGAAIALDADEGVHSESLGPETDAPAEPVEDPPEAGEPAEAPEMDTEPLTEMDTEPVEVAEMDTEPVTEMDTEETTPVEETMAPEPTTMRRRRWGRRRRAPMESPQHFDDPGF